MTRLLRAMTVLCALVGSLLLASPALATFPGRNGKLVVQPARGGGLIVVGPQGKGAQRICTDSLLCGAASTPRVSPDGRDIVFLDARSKAPVVVAPDGTCTWCLLGSPFSKLTGSTPAFMANGQAITLLVGGALERAPLSGGSAGKLRGGPITQPVWSASGVLAYARTGWIWIVPRGGAPRRLTRGAAPDFSPSGRQLAFTRSGWIWVIGTSGGTPQRLVRGGAPVFSPDGHKLAFIRSGRVYVAGVRGRGARALPGLRARALDWQPVPRSSRRPCAVPGGSTVVAQNPLAMITRNSGTPFTPWYGCLQAIGKRFPLVALPSAGNGYNAALQQVQVAGRFAAITVNLTDQFGNCSTAVDETDLSSGKTNQLYKQNCSTSLHSVDSLVLDTSGFVAWHAREQVAQSQPLIGVSCPSSSLCVAVDGHGNAFSSTAPTSGGWSLSHVAPAFTGINCPSTTLCIGIDGGNIVTTTNPSGGPWSGLTPIDAHALTGVACPPTGGFCVAVDTAGDVLWSTNPTGGAPAWQIADVNGSDFLSGVACPSLSRCIAVGQNGDVLTSTDPTNSASWTRSTAEPVAALTGVSCPSVSECVATDSAGNVLTSSDPGDASPTWTVTHVAPSSLSQPACATSCVVKDGGGEIFVSANPTAASPTWGATQLVSSPNALTSVGGCEQTQIPVDPSSPGGTAPCVATDEAGNAIVSSNPASGSWTTTPVDVPSCGACISEQVWGHDEEATQVFDQALLGPGNVLGNLDLAGNATTLRWTRAGAPQGAQLR